MKACPKEAIEIKYVVKNGSGGRKLPIININEQKCIFCGICELMCPFGALEVKIDGENINPVFEVKAFPELKREIRIEISKCEPSCLDCVKACPLSLIKRSLGRSPIKIDKRHCPCCRICETRCSHGAIHVKKLFQGLIEINPEKCPDGCNKCINACPIPGALYLSESGKVSVNPIYCIYCGACRVVCQNEGVIKLERISVNHTLIRSGAWIKALEKLTSIKSVVKELSTITLEKKHKVVYKRFA
jgi:4Fe-4S ferredoxin